MARDFASAAERFCSVIEEELPDLHLWLQRVEWALADLYATTIALPEGEPADLSVRWLSAGEWETIFEGIRSRLGDRDSYWLVSDPFDRRSLVQASIADDLTSIYRQVGAGLNALRSGAAPEEVLFGWRTSFEVHWGKHAVNALNAVREILRSDDSGNN